MTLPRRCRRAAAPRASSDDTAGRAANEVDEPAQLRPLRGRWLEPRERLAELQIAAINQAVGLADAADLLLGEPPAFEALGVDRVRNGMIARHHHIGRHVAGDDRATGQEGMRADPAMLMHRRETAENDPVPDLDVTGERDAVGEDRVASHHAVVRDVRIGYEEIVVADAGDALVVDRAAVERAAFAKDIAVADLEAGRLTGVFLVLRRIAQRSELIDPVARADRGRTVDDDMGADDGARTDANLRADDTEGTHGDVRRQLRLRRNDGMAVDHFAVSGATMI